MIDDSPARVVPDELPVLPLRDFVAFPYMVLPLFVARERSREAIEDALAGDRLVMLLAQRDPECAQPGPEDLHSVGTVAMVLRTMQLPDGRTKVLVQGLQRARVDSYIDNDAATWVRATAQPQDDDPMWSVEAEQIVRSVRSRVEELLPLKDLPPEVLSVTANVDKPGRMADLVASNLRLRVDEAQEILEIADPLSRLRRVDAFLRRDLETNAVEAEMHARRVDDDNEREAYLREQMRAIQNELGENDPRGEELDDYRIKLEDAELPPDAQEEAIRQLRRMERMHPDGPEAQVVRNYLDWMVELPWNNTTEDQLELVRARGILDADHAHLDRVKDRILEYLSVRKLRADSRGPILCFVGPPGVGKTSLGRSIARSMGREFVRVSLGGVKDEAEIRGHRRTYVGAMPGRIIQGLKTAGTNNPVFMLDEIDKLGSDFRGDPSAALLEVLDPEQNAKFSDHFLSVPFDLSKALFIATANMLEPIPAPLRDRHGGDPARRLHAGGEDRDRVVVPDPAPDRGERPRPGEGRVDTQRGEEARDRVHARSRRARSRPSGGHRVPQARAPGRRGRDVQGRREPAHDPQAPRARAVRDGSGEPRGRRRRDHRPRVDRGRG